jgi:hypothetical protein
MYLCGICYRITVRFVRLLRCQFVLSTYAPIPNLNEKKSISLRIIFPSFLSILTTSQAKSNQLDLALESIPSIFILLALVIFALLSILPIFVLFPVGCGTLTFASTAPAVGIVVDVMLLTAHKVFPAPTCLAAPAVVCLLSSELACHFLVVGRCLWKVCLRL